MSEMSVTVEEVDAEGGQVVSVFGEREGCEVDLGAGEEGVEWMCVDEGDEARLDEVEVDEGYMDDEAPLVLFGWAEEGCEAVDWSWLPASSRMYGTVSKRSWRYLTVR